MDAQRRVPPDALPPARPWDRSSPRRRLPPVLTSSATSLAATSRRNRGLRTLPDFGSGILVRTCGGSSKSRSFRRKNWRSCASTVGLPSRDETTTATPRRRARGTHTTSPGRSRATLSRNSSRRPWSRCPPIFVPELSGLLEVSPVLLEVSEVADHVRAVPLERRQILLAGPLEGDDASVREELGERRVQEMMCLLRRVVPHQVDRHVVRGAERGRQVVGAGRGEPGHPLERDLPLVDHDRMAERVDPSPARAAR